MKQYALEVHKLEEKDFSLSEKNQQGLEEMLGDGFFDDLEFLSKPEQEKKPKVKKKRVSPYANALSYLHDLVCLLSVVVVVFLLCFRVVVVSGDSMRDTLVDGDYLLLSGEIFYQQPAAGDVIVISKADYDNGLPLVKRIIATEGQWVDIDFRMGVVYVGDSLDSLQPLDEPYTRTPTNLFEGVEFPLQVPENCVFVLGDNRNDSKDSRNPQIGFVDQREILGKVIFLFYPGADPVSDEQDFGRIGVVS